MSENLKVFYENKYQEEIYNNKIPLISYKKYPLTRQEACIKFFTDNFKGNEILEIGSGDGIVAQGILNSNKTIKRFVASDISENRLKGIKNSISDNRLEIKEIDADNYDFDNSEKYDAILMVALMEHLINPINVMKNLKKLLKPNGFIYIDTPNIAEYGCRFKLLTGRFPSTGSKNQGFATWDGKPVTLVDEGHLHYFTYKSLSDMLINYCGYSKTEKYYFPIGKLFFGKAFHYKLAKMCPELFSELVLIAYN